MGQYHIVCNFTKRQFLHPHHFGEGFKLLEFGSDGGGTMTALALLLAASNGRGGGDYFDVEEDLPDSKYKVPVARNELIGSWAGDQIAIIGDYHEPGDCPPVGALPEGFWDAVTSEQDGWRDISADVRPVVERVMGWKFTFEEIKSRDADGTVTSWTMVSKPQEEPRTLRPDLVIGAL